MRRFLSSLILLPLSGSVLLAASLPPEPDQRLAHDIYKEIVDIQSGFTTGATTPVAQAVAARLRAAGFSEPDIFVGGAIPRKMNLVARYHGAGKRKPLLLPPAHQLQRVVSTRLKPGTHCRRLLRISMARPTNITASLRQIATS